MNRPTMSTPVRSPRRLRRTPSPHLGLCSGSPANILRGAMIAACLAPLATLGCRGARGEPWTIECMKYAEPGHEQVIDSVADVLRKTPGIDSRKVRVAHEPEGSAIYYGRYFRRIDRLNDERSIPPELKRDLEQIKQLYDDQGRRLFLTARMVPVPVEDVGPPEWNLANATGEYTLQVGVFFPTPELRDFKRAAVEFVRELRKRGYDAYYYHDRTRSIVTVGIFGPDAVYVRDNRVGYSPQVRALQKKETFRYNLTNGAIWSNKYETATGVVKQPVRSLLVRIPKKPPPQP